MEPRRPPVPVLEPESVRTSAAPPRSASQAPRPPHPSISGREDADTAAARPKDFAQALAKLQQQRQTGAPAPLPPTDPAHALAQLQRQREIGAPAPPPPPSKPSALGGVETQRMGADSPRRLPSAAPAGIKDSYDVPSAAALAKEVQNRPAPGEMLGSPPPIQPIVPSTKSITSPLSALNLKPGTSPLSPSRAPAPIAIVGGSSLKINSPDKAITPSRPPPANLLAAIDANAPKLPTDSFVPPPLPLPLPAATTTAKGLAPSVPPAAPSSRPNTASKSFSPPAGGPPAQYERAFRQWSSPNISTADEASPENVGPVTFQVYTAQDISAGRAPMRSLPAVPREPKKASLAARVGMAAVGGVIVLLTAAAVIAVSTEDPKPPAPSATVTAQPTLSVTTEPDPAPSAISIGDPVDPIDELPETPPPATAAAHVTQGAAPAPPKPKPKPATTSTTPAAPASLKGMAPPPNPYGK